MPLSYAGISLTLATEEVDQFLHNYLPYKDIIEEETTFWATADLQPLNLPPNPLSLRKLMFGCLYWPSYGACRTATFHQVITSTKLAQITSAVSDESSPQPLVMSDQRDGASISALMYLLPPRPLMQIPNQEQLFLLSLVDIRGLLLWQPGSIDTQPASWTDLYSSLAALLGISLTVDTIDSAYGTPSTRWIIYEHSLPAILDAVANTVGQRILFKLDGTAAAVNWTTAKTNSDNQIATQLARSGQSKTAGGQFVTTDLTRWVPASVRTVFANGSGTDVVPFATTDTLTGLAISQYGSANGIPSRTRTIVGDLVYDGTNSSACIAYGTQAATDWYGWQLNDLDVAFPGIVNWIPTAWEDSIEWVYQIHETEMEKILTRLNRGPFYGFQPGIANYDLTGATQTVNVLTNSCPIFSSGIQVGQTDEYTPLTLPASVIVGTPFCVENPDNCCITPIITACCDNPIPSELCITFSGDPCDSDPSCWSGLSFILYYEGTTTEGVSTWLSRGPFPPPYQALISVCGYCTGIYLTCQDGGGEWYLGFLNTAEAPYAPCEGSSCDALPYPGEIAYSSSCDPFSVTFFDLATVVPLEGSHCGSSMVSYNCIEDICQDPGDGTGEFATLALCEGSGCGAGITVTDGTIVDSSGEPTQVIINSVEIPANSLLVVSYGYVANPGYLPAVTANFAGSPLSQDGVKQSASGIGGAYIFSLFVPTATTGQLKITNANGLNTHVMGWSYVNGLVSNSPDLASGGTIGVTSAPDSGSVGPTVTANTYVHAVVNFEMFTPGNPDGMDTWTGGFSNGLLHVVTSVPGQEVHVGHKILSATGSVDAALVSSGNWPPDFWEAVVVAYK